MATVTKVGVAGRTALCLGAAMVVGLLVGCASMPDETASPVITARYTAAPVQIDGILDDAVWNQAVAYPLALAAADLAEGKPLTEGGEVRVAWDDQFIYVAVRFVDSDIVAEGEEDQLHHYRMGDVAEFFLKPADHTWYWEMYATPAGRKTTLWFPGRGRLGLPSAETSPGGLRVAAQCQGTLNDWRDVDQSWTAEMALPVSDMVARGENYGIGSRWTMMLARYNYGRYLDWKELSMAPAISKPNYHLIEDYATIDFVK